jgi:hypothetical protein
MPSDLVLAWASGFFDGEGCVVVELSKSPASAAGYRTSLHATVTQTSIPCLEIFVKHFGGAIKTYQFTSPNSTRWAVQYTWAVRNEKALEFIKAIRPFSVVKASQIDEALKYPFLSEDGKKYGNRGNPLPKHIWEERLRIRLALQDLRAASKTKAAYRYAE